MLCIYSTLTDFALHPFSMSHESGLPMLSPSYLYYPDNLLGQPGTLFRWMNRRVYSRDKMDRNFSESYNKSLLHGEYGEVTRVTPMCICPLQPISGFYSGSGQISKSQVLSELEFILGQKERAFPFELCLKIISTF
jgi:hypothetical protein